MTIRYTKALPQNTFDQMEKGSSRFHWRNHTRICQISLFKHLQFSSVSTIFKRNNYGNDHLTEESKSEKLEMSKVKIKFREIFKDLFYCLSVVFNSGLSNFVENLGFKISFIFLLQCPNQQFNIQIFSGMNQIMTIGIDLVRFRVISIV